MQNLAKENHMSWSVSGSGNSEETARAIESQFESYSVCPEPEESIKQAARALIAKALAGKIPSTDTTVTAWGSQTTKYGVDGAPDEVNNTLSISIT
jgi:hypothetical protein